MTDPVAPLKLDERTEEILGHVAACYSAVGYASSSARSKKRALDDAGESMVNLRSRIRELVAEASRKSRASIFEHSTADSANPRPVQEKK